MKEIFYNSVGANTAAVTCKNDKGTFILHFHLSDNPVQHIWQKIHADNENIITSEHQGRDIDTLVKDINQLCICVNAEPLTAPINQIQLNRLHKQYVLSDKTNYWSDINHLIHCIESKIDNPFNKFDSSVTFFAEKENVIPITDNYKIFLDNNVTWGKMILGYGTLGKDWNSISSDNDDNSDLAVQCTVDSETRLLFCPEQVTQSYQEQKFYKWATSTKINVPINDLTALSLGRYVLGQIIITDTLLNYHNNPSDWYVPNHRCKWMWNKEIFTPDTVISKVTFENTDMLFDLLTKHAGLEILNV